MKKIIMFVMVLVIGLTAGIANAALLAEESFEYTPGELLKNQNGGTGWATEWSADEYQATNGAKIGTGSLAPPVVVGTAGNHVKVVIDTEEYEAEYQRVLTTPLKDDGSIYWVSALLQKTNSDNNNSWSGFALGENIWFGKGYDEDNIVLWSNAGGMDDTGVPGTDLSWLVVKIETNPAADEQVYLWVNPDADNEPSISTADAYLEIPLGAGGADFFNVESGGQAANSGDFTCDEIRIGTLFDDVFIEVGPKNPISIDPNVMTVYEEGTTQGDFTVGLKFPAVKQAPPNEGTPVTVDFVVDPNGGVGPNPDIDFLDGVGGMDRVTFSRTGNDLSQVVIRFQAINDVIPEPPNLEEEQEVLVYTTCAQEPNFVRSKIARLSVMDNDQANILFAYTLPEKNPVFAEVTGPVQIWEEPRLEYGTPYTRWRKIWVKLQVPPLVDGDPCQPSEVKLNMEVTGDIIGDNLPLTDPCLPFLDIHEPNGLIFTAANYDTYQSIKIWGNDDDVLQVEGASAEGQQNYSATLNVWVVDGGGDPRYEWIEIDDTDPCEPVEFLVGLESEIQIDIEDNECGAFGTRSMDVGNPNAFTDPNYRDSDGNPLPDCIVDINDAIWLAIKWLDCSDIHDPSCESYL